MDYYKTPGQTPPEVVEISSKIQGTHQAQVVLREQLFALKFITSSAIVESTDRWDLRVGLNSTCKYHQYKGHFPIVPFSTWIFIFNV